MPQRHKRPAFFATGNFKEPERTRDELERLRITIPQIPATPPRWRRIDPAHYLKERGA